MNATLRLSFLGMPQIQLGDESVSGLTPRKVKALLIYLAYTAQPQPREHLAELFFDDRSPEQAAANLRAMISRLRHKLKPFIVTDQDSVAFANGSDFWLDTAVLTPILQTVQRQINQNKSLTPATAVQLTDALALSRGDFLAGFHIREARNFEEWALLERERWRHQLSAALQALVAYHLHRREYAAGIAQARQLIRLDNLQENAHRQLMLLLARSGNRTAALAQYESCRHILAQELGVEPMAETTALYERIRAAQTAVLHNLPPQFTPFVGRSAELAQISQRLDDPNCRLLTLVGGGGVGKTRLALEAASERSGDYVNGVAFVPLAPLDDPALLVTAVANVLQFNFSGRDPLKNQLLDHLRPQEMLLVLDNFEHVLAGSDLVLDILKAAPDVKILATSRERLDFSMEWTLDIRGLAYPENEEKNRQEKTPLLDYAAVQLFFHNARRANAEFVLDGHSEPLTRHICALLEGLPLGLELAAAAVRERPLAELAASIAENAAILATTMRDISPRHRSLQAVFNHSWALLTTTEQQALKQLTVFRGSFDQAAAAAVTGAAPAVLTQLVQKSLVRQRENGRYDLHELWRQLGGEKLAPAEREDAQGRHGRYYALWLDQKTSDSTGDKQIQTLALITTDIENIRAGWHWATAQNEWGVIQQYLNGFNEWHNTRALFQEGADIFEQTIAAIKCAGTPSKETSLLMAQLLAHQGFFLSRLAFFDLAQEKLQESLTILRPFDELKMMLKPLGGLANIAIMQGDYVTAKKLYQENLAIARRLEIPHAIASNLEGIAMLVNHEGKHEEARDLFQECLDMQREMGDFHQAASTLGNLGVVYFDLKQYAQAEKTFTESLNLRREFNDQHGIVLMLSNLAELAFHTEDYKKAKNLYQECSQVSEVTNHRIGQSDSQLGLGDVYFAQGDYEIAEEIYLAALKGAQAAQLTPNALTALVGLSGVLFQRHLVNEAAKLLSFVWQHPALNQDLKNRGAWLDSALNEALTPRERAAIARGTADLSLDEIAAAVSGFLA